MKISALICFSIILLGACEDASETEGLTICMDEYYFYNGGEKNIIHPSLEGLYIYFKDTVLSENDGSIEIFKKYPYLLNYYPESLVPYISRYAIITTECDCETLTNYLTDLNSDPEISSAFPHFHYLQNPGREYCIGLQKEIIFSLKDDFNIIDFQYVLDSVGLEIIEENRYGFIAKVLTINTGFEPLEKANQLYELRQTEWSCPNFTGGGTLAFK